MEVSGAGRNQIKLNLTLKGGQLLSGVSSRKFKAKGTFTPKALSGTTVSRMFGVSAKG